MTIFKQTLKRICSSKIKLVLLFLCPVLFTVMFMSGTNITLRLLVVDNDHTELSQKLIADLGALKGGISVISVDADQAVDKIVSYQSDASITIPKGFEDAVLTGKEAAVEEYHILDTRGIYFTNVYIDGFVADMKTLAEGSGHDRSKFNNALAEYDKKGLSAQNLSDSNGNMSGRARGSIGFLVQFMLYMSLITAGIILEDRSSGVYYRTFFAPVSLKRYFAENLLAFLVIGVVQAVIAITIQITVFGIQYANVLTIYVLAVVFALVCVALGMWIITFFRKPLMAYLTILFLTTPLVMLGNCYWPASFMPDMIQKISMFMPTTWMMQAVTKVVDSGATVWAVGPELLVMLLFTGIFLAAGLVKKVDIAK